MHTSADILAVIAVSCINAIPVLIHVTMDERHKKAQAKREQTLVEILRQLTLINSPYLPLVNKMDDLEDKLLNDALFGEEKG